MVYLANVSTNEVLTLEIYDQLIEMGIETYKPNENIQFQGREININAFDQLRKRNPNNPYIIELKQTIMNILKNQIIKNNIFLLVNRNDEQFIKETIFELSIAWLLNKVLLSYSNITPANGELVIAMNIKSLQTDIIKIKNYIKEKEENEQLEKEINVIKRRLGGKQKLTVQ